MHEAGINRQQATAAPAVEQGDKHGADQVAEPGLWQDRPHLALSDGARFHAQRQEHGVAGEQFRASDDDQGQGDTKGGAHHQRTNRGIEQIAEGEN